MTYATLLVHLQSGRSNVALLAATGRLAAQFGSHVIGIAACQPMMVVSGDGYVCGDVYDSDQRQITNDLKTAEDEFRQALGSNGASLEWRAKITIATVADYLSVEARCADLVITSSMPADTFDLARAANPGALAIQAGRPVLIVPPTAGVPRYEHAVIAWKDTRESRRAACDAIPLLKQFAKVTVVEIAAFDDVDATTVGCKDVVAWLDRHGVVAQSRVARSTSDEINQLCQVIDEEGADLIVAGAYGHNRLREWAMGGVTRNLLLDATQCVFVSH